MVTANPFSAIYAEIDATKDFKRKAELLLAAMQLLEKTMVTCSFWSRTILAFPFFWVVLRRIPKWGWRVLARRDGSFRAGYLTLGWLQFGFRL